MHELDASLISAAGGVAPAAAAAAPLVRLVRPDVRLESALLYFLASLRRGYISEVSGMPPPPASATAPRSAAALLRSAAADAGVAAGVVTAVSGGSLSYARGGANASISGGMSDMGGGNSGAGGGSSGAAELPHSTSQSRFLSMFERMGLGSHVTVVGAMLGKVGNNLRWRGDSADIVRRSLDVLHDLIFSYSSSRLLLAARTGPVMDLLACHGPEHFPFLAMREHARARATFYTSLARLVFFEDDTDRFLPFLAPLSAALDALAPHATSRDEKVGAALAGAARDWRGVLLAAHNRASYSAVFDVLHPVHIDTLARGAEAWADVPHVANAILKLFAELVLQRGTRINFGNSSPNGILLFRAASRVVVAHAARVAALPVPFGSDAYALKYKGVAVCAAILSRALDGNYVNFGVFALYGDPALESAARSQLLLLLSVPPSELLTFAKVAQQYTVTVHLLARSHMELLVALPSPAFRQLIRSLSECLDSLDNDVAQHAACAVNFIATFFVQSAGKDTPAAHALRAHVAAMPTIFQLLMGILFRVLVFDEAHSQSQSTWTLVRPLLPVILAAEIMRPDSLDEYKNELTASQPAELRGRMNEEFLRLARDITRWVKKNLTLTKPNLTRARNAWRLA